MKKKWLGFLTACLILLTVACQQEEVSNSATESDNDVPYAIEGDLPSSPPAQGWIADAVVDLAERLEINTEAVSFIAFELPVWPDTGYGCPQTGQEIQPESKEGYQIQLQVNGRDYFYHGGEDIEQFLCENN